MRIERLTAVTCLAVAACAGGGPVAETPAGPEPSPGAAPTATAPTPRGPERLYLGRRSPLELAPGREEWLSVSAFVVTSASSMEPVPPLVTWSSSDTAVARVTPAEGGTARVVARRAGTATLTIRSTRDPANVLTTPVTVRVAPVGDERGLVYAATAALRPSSGGSATDEAPLGPMELDVRVTISNSAAESRSLWLSACAAWIRIYRTADRAGPPVADLPRGTECGSGPQVVTFAPGESKSYPGLGYRLTLASDTLPTGRFYVAAAVDRLRDLHEVPAGAVDVVSPNAGLAFTGTTTVATAPAGSARDTVHTRIAVRNTNAQGVRLEYGACALDLLAFRAPTRSGTPAWTSSAQRAPNGQPFACPLYLAMGVLRPGQEVSPGELNTRVPARALLGDSLPAGRYYFRARVRFNWRTTLVDAGEADLRR